MASCTPSAMPRACPCHGGPPPGQRGWRRRVAGLHLGGRVRHDSCGRVGLTLAGSSAFSHDLYARVFCKGAADPVKEARVSRISTFSLGAIAVALGIAFRTQNVAYMISLTFSLACSSMFPVPLLALYWGRLTTAGAVTGGSVGLISAILLTAAGPAVWVNVLGHAAPLISIDPPAIITMPTAFVTCWLVSLLDRSKQAVAGRTALDGMSGAAAR